MANGHLEVDNVHCTVLGGAPPPQGRGDCPSTKLCLHASNQAVIGAVWGKTQIDKIKKLSEGMWSKEIDAIYERVKHKGTHVPKTLDLILKGMKRKAIESCAKKPKASLQARLDQAKNETEVKGKRGKRLPLADSQSSVQADSQPPPAKKSKNSLASALAVAESAPEVQPSV